MVVLDREQGGKQLLQRKRLSSSYLFSISEVVEILKSRPSYGRRSSKINEFISGNKIEFKEEKDNFLRTKLENCEHSVGKKNLRNCDC